MAGKSDKKEILHNPVVPFIQSSTFFWISVVKSIDKLSALELPFHDFIFYKWKFKEIYPWKIKNP